MSQLIPEYHPHGTLRHLRSRSLINLSTKLCNEQLKKIFKKLPATFVYVSAAAAVVVVVVVVAAGVGVAVVDAVVVVVSVTVAASK